MAHSKPGTEQWAASVERARSILKEFREKGWSDARIQNLLVNCCQNVPIKYISQLFTDANRREPEMPAKS